jgi:hypothetical protein
MPGFGEPRVQDRLQTDGSGTREGVADGAVAAHGSAMVLTDCDVDVSACDDAMSLLARTGIRRAVLNHLPVSAAPGALPNDPDGFVVRAVIAAPQGATAAQLLALHRHGVRGVRFGGAEIRRARRYADRIAAFGWHVEIDLAAMDAAADLTSREWELMCFPVAVCLRGLGEANDGLDHGALAMLVQTGRFWIKLTGADIRRETAGRLARLIAVRPDRVVWGSGRSGGVSAPGDQARRIAAALHTVEAACAETPLTPRRAVANAIALYDLRP